jgi:O-6-methylguanine DNA methyltransferase
MAMRAPPIKFDAPERARFSAAFDAVVPQRLEARDANALVIRWVDSPVGPLLIGAVDEAIVLLEFCDPDQLAERLARIRKSHGRSLVQGEHPLLVRLRAQLGEYFAATRTTFDVPLSFPGSGFQERVWSALRTIPYGATCSYGDIAKQLGDANMMRAVGAANGANPIAIVIPCHRVVNANGDLGGFGGGLWRKQILLDLERGQGSLF